jgi:predicted acyl esterase
VRGKHGSEGEYLVTRPVRGPLNPSGVDHTTDAWDTVDWLVSNLPESNGRVGMIGSSYEGFTVVMALLDPHPALKVAAPESPLVDGWMGDDWFHHGAFRQVNLDAIASMTGGQGRAVEPSSGKAMTTTRISGGPARRASTPGLPASTSFHSGGSSMSIPPTTIPGRDRHLTG